MYVSRLLMVCARRLQIARFTYGVIVAFWLATVAIVPVASAQAAEQLIAQKPFVATVVEGMALTKTSNGVPMAVFMPQGINALLEAVNLKTMQRVKLDEQRVDGQQTSGKAYITLPNRHVLIGTTTGFVYDVNPDTLAVVELELPAAMAKPAFQRVVLGEKGVAYFAGTVGASSHLYAYNYLSSNWRDIGTIPSATKGLAYAAGAVYVGSTGTSANVWRITLPQNSQGQVTSQGLPANLRDVFVEAADKDFLYASAQTDKGLTLIYDLKQDKWHDQQPGFGQISLAPPEPEPIATPTAPVAQNTPPAVQPTSGTNTTDTSPADQLNSPTNTNNSNANSQNNANEKNPKNTDTNTTTNTVPSSTTEGTTATQPVSQQTSSQNEAPSPAAPVLPPAPKPVYFGGLAQYDPATKTSRTYTSNPGFQPVTGNCWIDMTRCVVYTSQGRLALASTSSRGFKLTAPSPIVGGYQSLDLLAIGPDDTIYAGSSVPGTTLQHIDSKKTTLRKSVDTKGNQLTSLVATERAVIAGTAQGKIMEYDPSSQTTAPAFMSGISVGSSSVSALVATEQDKVAFAIAQAGSTTGASVGVYDTRKHTVTSKPLVISSLQSISSLAYRKGILYIGGTTTGVTGSAQVVAYDVATRSVRSKMTPVLGANSVGGIAASSDGKLFGVAEGTVFIADADTLGVIQKKQLAMKTTESRLVLRASELSVTIAGKLYKVDINDLKETYVANASQVAVNVQGDTYYGRNGGLYSILVQRSATSAAPTATRHLNSGVSPVDIKLGASGGLFILMIILLSVFKIHIRRPTYMLKR